jgi:plasmid replication initiation protein
MTQAELFDRDGLVVKSNQLVQARINWTKLEHRVVSMLISQLKKDDEVFSLQRVYIKDLLDLSGTKSRDVYDRAEEICQKLLDQKVHVRTQTDDGRRVYQGFNCMSTCRYVEGSGYIEAKFNDDMKPFLLQLRKRFTMYKLQNFMRLSSQHSMRLYELIKMREGITYLRISVRELREILCCEHTYERFSDFKRYVLEKARKELKEVCDVYFTYKVERQGRTPVRVNFMVHQEGSGSGEKIEPKSERKATLDEQLTHKDERPKQEGGSPKFNFYAMVLSDLTQDELNRLDKKEIEKAIKRANAKAEERHPASASSVIASQTVSSALSCLRKSLD